MNWLQKGIAMLRKGAESKKGMAQQSSLIVGFVVLAITAAIGALVISNIDSTFAAGTAQRNTTTNTLTAFNNYSLLLPVVGTVLAAVLILGLVIGGLAVFGRSR